MRIAAFFHVALFDWRMTDREEFLRGDRPDDVAIYLADEAISNPAALAEYAESVGDGLVVVLPGERGRRAFQSAAGIDPMTLAQAAMHTAGDINDDLTGGTCPVAETAPDDDHTIQFVFAFAESQNEDVDGIYAEGDVIHAYAVCSCGERFSEKWVVEG